MKNYLWFSTSIIQSYILKSQTAENSFEVKKTQKERKIQKELLLPVTTLLNSTIPKTEEQVFKLSIFLRQKVFFFPPPPLYTFLSVKKKGKRDV